MSGWNGSGQRGNSAPIQPKAKAKKPSPVRGLIAGFLVCALAAVAYFVFFSGDRIGEDDENSGRKGSRIKEAVPASASKNGGKRPDARASATRVRPDRQQGKKEDVVLKPVEKPNQPKYPPAYTNVVNGPKARYEVFKHRSETHLAILACAPYGTMMIGGFDYDEAFMKDLDEALKEDIVIAPEDEEDVRQYKEAVIAMKKQIKQMMALGEDVPKALDETRKELQQMGVYKAQLEAAMTKIRQEKGDGDLEELVGAVNEMLKDKGIEPFGFSKLTGEVFKRKPFASPDEEAQEEADRADAEQAALEEREAQKGNEE